MVLDIELFRFDKGGNPNQIKENQKKRYKDMSLVDKVIESDTKWRQYRFIGDKFNTLKNACSKEIGIRMKMKETFVEVSEISNDLLSVHRLTTELIKSSTTSDIKRYIVLINETLKENATNITIHEKERNETLAEVGNILHLSVPISNNEDDNEVVFISDNITLYKRYSHVDLIHMIDGVDMAAGSAVAGGRGYYLKGPCVLLQIALVQMAFQKWTLKGYQPVYTPCYMHKEVMRDVAQLAQFDEELYKVIGKASEKMEATGEYVADEEKYLIATSEQPLAALHRGQWISETSLPIRYVGQSTCFRQEVGSHGRDTGGIFRVHQFEKIEQFVLTSPFENKSWEMMDELMDNCKEFYNELGIAFRIVNVVSGALNNSASKKLDLEAWFPGSRAFRELVSCSNCLDYQSRKLLIRFGQTKKENSHTNFVHMLNATACATTRVICAILETYQTGDGIEIPSVLKKYFPPNYPDVIPFKKKLPHKIKK